MSECPYNPGINADRCKDCTLHCGFVPDEIARRKRAIANGEGLKLNAYGLLRLKIRKRRDIVHVHAD